MTNSDQETQKNQVEKDSKDFSSTKNDQPNLLNYRLSFSDSQKRFLILSAIIPLAIFLLQIANLVFVIINPPPGPTQELTFSRIVDMTAPLIIMTTMSILGLLNFIFLLSWKRKITRYNNQKQLFKKMIAGAPNESDDTEFISFAQLSYQNLKHMKMMRIFSYITNTISIVYILWIIRGILAEIGIAISGVPIPRPPLVLYVLNTIAQIVLLVYIVIQWMFFHKWNKKLLKIELFEKQTIDELEL